jgi:putative membrane protein
VIRKFIQGIAIGVAFVLPGLSAGTVILLLGFYRKFLEDLSRVNLQPYLLHILGGAVGVLAGVRVIGYLMERATDLLMAFLLGALVASIRIVLAYNGKIKAAPVPLILSAAGFAITWFIVCEPSSGMTVLPPGSLFHFFLGGTVASATMLLPGVSGSSALIIMNLYDDVIIAVNQWQWLKLSVFTAGLMTGLFGLARLLSALYRRYSTAVSFLLSGLILGSTRALLPLPVKPGVAAAVLAGALLVIYFGGRKTPADQ